MVCAIVPARGGSKGLPGKNLRLLAGRPLIAHAIQAGLDARLVERVLVSTDDAEIAGVARACGADVPFLRPADLGRDETPTVAVLRHAIEWLSARREEPDIVVLLQATSPFRTAAHVDHALQLLRDSRADSAVSVCEVDHSPYWMYSLAGAQLTPFLPHPLNGGRRQEQPRLYRLNGAIYVTSPRLVMQEDRIVGDRPAAVVMSREESVDIEDEHDLEWAEWLASKRAARA